jgi:hypothetical protein
MFLAISLTGTAFHAKIPVHYHRLLIDYFENVVRTNNGAHPAAVAFHLIQFEGDHIAQVN